jgi:pyruvate/2-oxoglutarate dehydrogenase complex dihydrolipoamide dehydrogenase (E3) component
MKQTIYDFIVIGCGSGGLSFGLFMGKAGFRTLMISTTEHAIGGDCLNDGCVPSKSLIHVARMVRDAKQATRFGLQSSGTVDMQTVRQYIKERQDTIRTHENSAWLREQGVDVALGTATFSGTDSVEVNGKRYTGKRIVISTGSRPKKADIKGIDHVAYFDNESIFDLEELPARLLVLGGGPIGIEVAQAMCRLGSEVTVVHSGGAILEHDDEDTTTILLERLKQEGIRFYLNSELRSFPTATEAVVVDGSKNEQRLGFDAVFVAIGRTANIEALNLENAGIAVQDGKIVTDNLLRTTNRKVFICGDVAGDLQFSHAAEFHARILINNFLSPFRKRVSNNLLSWVTFTDPEVATFGRSEKLLTENNIQFEKLAKTFNDDDRAVTDEFQYSRVRLFISKKRLLQRQKILGGSMVAPGAGELVQDLILAMSEGLPINAIFNKIYPYPTASRINQAVIVDYKSASLTPSIKKVLSYLFRLFG